MNEFHKDELILVDVYPNVEREKWIPARYIGKLPNGLHEVEYPAVYSNGYALYSYATGKLATPEERESTVTRALDIKCLRHSWETYELKVHYEVYVDFWRGSDVLEFEGISAEQKAMHEAHEWATEIRKKADRADSEVVVDKVVVGGNHKYRYDLDGNRRDIS